MLYGVGSHLGCVVSTSSGEFCTDTDNIIADFDPEAFTISRDTPSFSSGVASQSWASIDSFTGDWQPASGRTTREEEGRKTKSEAFIISPCTANSGSNLEDVVKEGDRIILPDASFMYVNYVKKYKGHVTIFLTRTKGSE